MTTQHSVHIPNDWIIPKDRFNNPEYIETRCATTEENLKGNLRSALKYLYLDHRNGGISSFNKDVKNIILNEKLLEDREIIIFKYLFTRTNGSEKYVVGRPGIIAAKTSRYKCENCGNPDVRVLCLDHIWDGNVLVGFKMLCNNCHGIKSREEDWNGTKKNRDKKEALKALIQRIPITETI